MGFILKKPLLSYFHSSQTTGHARDLSTSGDFRSLSRFIAQKNFHNQPPSLEPPR